MGLDDADVDVVEADALIDDDKKELAADDTFASAVLTNTVGTDIGTAIVAGMLSVGAVVISDIPPEAKKGSEEKKRD